jgi:transcriptional/translational regulatory protein YebC/TACO1
LEAVTDKKQRTVADVKTTLEKNGGTMAGQGAVSFQFQRAGELVVPKNSKTSDEVLGIALENNVSDYEEEDDAYFLYTDPQNLQSAKEGIERAGLKIEDASLVYKPIARTKVTEDQEERIFSLIEKLEDMDDVQKVYTNLDSSS